MLFALLDFFFAFWRALALVCLISAAFEFFVPRAEGCFFICAGGCGGMRLRWACELCVWFYSWCAGLEKPNGDANNQAYDDQGEGDGVLDGVSKWVIKGARLDYFLTGFRSQLETYIEKNGVTRSSRNRVNFEYLIRHCPSTFS